MGLLDRLAAERRGSIENPATPFTDPDLWDSWDFGGPTSSGARVNAMSAYQVAAFYAGVRFISETIASLPLKLYRRLPNGDREQVTDDPRISVWRDAPNPQMSAYTLREVLQGHKVTWGNAFVEVVRDGAGNVREAWPLLPDRTEREYKNGQVSYVTEVSPGKKVRLPGHLVMHIPGFGFDGRLGHSLLTLARETLGSVQSANAHAGKFFANGLRPSGVLSSPAILNPTTRGKLKQSIKEQVGGLSNTQRLLLLEGGITFTSMGLPPGDAQFLEQRQFGVREIARFLNLPAHILNDLERQTFANIEQQSLELVVYRLRPWFRRWEDGLKKDMLSPEERSSMFWKIDERGLLRGDSEARMKYLHGRFNTGSMTSNEIRAIEDENRLEGGDTLFVHSAMVPIDQARDMTVDDRVRLLAAANGGPGTTVPESREVPAAGNALVLDMWERLCKGEVRELSRIAKRGGSIDEYYQDKFPSFASKILAPLGGDTEALVSRYAFDARQQLQDLAPEQVALVLDNWTDRARMWSDGST